MPKIINNRLNTYDKITKNIYDSYFILKLDLLKIVEIQINNRLILDKNIFTSNKKKVIKSVRIIQKNCKIFFTISYIPDFINSRDITKTKLLSKKNVWFKR